MNTRNDLEFDELNVIMLFTNYSLEKSFFGC
jgi:hypothetical protein